MSLLWSYKWTGFDYIMAEAWSKYVIRTFSMQSPLINMHHISCDAFGHEVCIIGSQCHCHDIQLNINAQNKSSTMQYRPTTNNLQISCTISEHKNGYWTHTTEAKEITILWDCTKKKIMIQYKLYLLKSNVCFVMLCLCVNVYCTTATGCQSNCS
jgi:hypothetical protein